MFSGVKKKYKDFFSISMVQSDYFELRESIHNFKVDLKCHWNDKLHDFQLISGGLNRLALIIVYNKLNHT